MVTDEEWKTIPEFSRYEASTMGRFRNKSTGKYMGGTTAHNGYLHIGLMKNGQQITKLSHRMIADTFLEKPSPLHSDVNHKNKVRTDNRVSNLEWSTRSYNSKHSKKPVRNSLSLWIACWNASASGLSAQARRT